MIITEAKLTLSQILQPTRDASGLFLQPQRLGCGARTQARSAGFASPTNRRLGIAYLMGTRIDLKRSPLITDVNNLTEINWQKRCNRTVLFVLIHVAELV